MNYIVIEMQTNAGQTSTLTYQFKSLQEAEQKYYQILSAAVVSEIDIHSAIILDEAGFLLKNESFRHIKEETQE